MKARRRPHLAAILALAFAAGAHADERASAPDADAVGNAALSYWSASSFLPEHGSAAGTALERFSKGEDPGTSGSIVGERWMVSFLHDGAAQPLCDWGEGLAAHGPAALLPHLDAARTLVRCAGLIAYRRAQAGRAEEAGEVVLDALCLARGLEGGRHCSMTILAGYGCEQNADQYLVALVPTLSLHARASIAKRLSAWEAPAGNPSWSERQLVRWIERALADDRPSVVAQLCSIGLPGLPRQALVPPRVDALLPRGAAAIGKAVGQLRDAVDELDRAWSLGDDAFDERLAALRRQLFDNACSPLLLLDQVVMVRDARAKARLRSAALLSVLQARRLDVQDPELAAVHAAISRSRPIRISVPGIATASPITLLLGWPWEGMPSDGRPTG